jgi:HemY protein
VKRVILVLLAALFVGGLIGALVARDPGYVLVSYSNVSVETSLWFGVFLLLLAYVLLRLGSYLWSRFVLSGSGLAQWNRQRRADGSRKQTVQGLLLSAEGRWSEAHKLLLAGARDAQMPLVNYLSAARSAQALGNYAERDELLSRASEETPGSKVAVALTRVAFQLEADQYEPALASLLELQRESPRNAAVLAMLQRCYGELGDWQALLELAPDLRRQKALPEAELDAAQRRAGLARLAQLTGPAASGQFEAVWNLLPKTLQHDPELIAAAASARSAQGHPQEAEQLLSDALKRAWDDRLVDCYGVVDADLAGQLNTAEGWLKDRPDNAALLLALGRLAGRSEQWDKAREYLEASLRSNPDGGVYAELGHLCVRLGDAQRGAEYLARALANGAD